MLQRLRSAQGAQFNQLYAQEMVREHQNAVDRIANYAQQGDNPQLKQYASQLLPTERQHLQEAQQLQRQVGQG
jgi:putative membrane protein